MVIASMLVLLLLIHPFNTAFAEGSKLIISEEKCDKTGLSVVVSVELEIATPVAELQADFSFDISRLELNSIGYGSVFVGQSVPNVDSNTDGAIRCSWKSEYPIATDGTLLLLEFAVKECESGMAEVAVNKETLMLSDVAGLAVEVDVTNGGVMVHSNDEHDHSDFTEAPVATEQSTESAIATPGITDDMQSNHSETTYVTIYVGVACIALVIITVAIVLLSKRKHK